MNGKPVHYQYNIKCLFCGLHFKVFSWKVDWNLSHDAVCPECGDGSKTIVLKKEASYKQIFEFVSG